MLLVLFIYSTGSVLRQEGMAEFDQILIAAEAAIDVSLSSSSF
jgi:hypothetical protein